MARRWFHGSRVDIQGDLILPPATTGADVNHPEFSDPGRVYVSPCAVKAARYGGSFPVGSVLYEVTPHAEPIELDDYDREFETTGATVVRRWPPDKGVMSCDSGVFDSCPGRQAVPTPGLLS